MAKRFPPFQRQIESVSGLGVRACCKGAMNRVGIAFSDTPHVVSEKLFSDFITFQNRGEEKR